MLKINQAAKLLGVSAKTLRRWEKSGKLTSERSASGYRLYDPEQLKELKLVKGLRNELKIEKKDLGGNTASSFVSSDKKGIFNQLKQTLEQAGQYPQAVKTTWPSLRYIKLSTTGILVSVLVVTLVSSYLSISSLISSQIRPGMTKEDSQVLGESTKRLLGGSISFNVPAAFNNLVKFKDSVKFEGESPEVDISNGIITALKVTAANLIYSLTSGDGISITTNSQDPTIKNTGVLSLQSKTGALTLTEGTDITIDGLKITNKSTLDTVRGRGGCSSCIVDADVASGLTISGGTVNDSAIGASTPSTGAFTTLSASSTLSVTGASTLTGNVGIGASLTATGLGVFNGGLTVSGLSNLTGNVGIGTSNGNIINLSGRVGSDIIPASSGTYSLGSSSLPWSQLYLTGIASIGGQSTFTSPPTGTGVGNGSIYINPSSVSDSSYTLFPDFTAP